MQRTIGPLNSDRFTNEFCHWVWKFIAKENLFEHPKDLVLLCSGGADSLGLFYVIARGLPAYQKKLKVLYFHHGTRNSSEHEHEMVLIQEAILKVQENEISLRDKIEFHVLSLSGLDLRQSDFENRARKNRREMLNQYFPSEEHYYLTGHHIDDSFEWWLRGRLTQSQPQKPLGIPLKNGSYRRPFHCVTKAQILKFMEKSNYEFAFDSSNLETKFERNFLRNEVIQKLKTRYPKYLRHYVFQRMAELDLEKDKKKKRKVLELAENLYYFSLKKNGENELQSLEEILLFYSRASQGMLRKALWHSFSQKGATTQTNGLKGPLSFSGDLHLWQWHHHYFLWVNKNRPKKELERLDQILCEWLLQNNLHLRTIKEDTQAKLLAKLFESLGIVLENQNKNPRNLAGKTGFMRELCPNFYQSLRDKGFELRQKNQ